MKDTRANLISETSNITNNSVMAIKKIFTLVFVKKNDEILLGLKTRGLGVGLWNGFGGKVEGEETILEGAKRELKEECNLEVSNLKHLGVVLYEEENETQKSLVHIFTVKNFRGILKPSEEMNPVKWYEYHNIPYTKMWPDAKFWYPHMLNDNYFSAIIKYGCEGNIVDTNIIQYEDISHVLKSINV